MIRAYQAIVRGEAQHAATAAKCIQAAYAKASRRVRRADAHRRLHGHARATSCATSPRRPAAGAGSGEEAAFAFNFRPDRMREISAMFTRKGLPPNVEEMLLDRGKPIVAFGARRYASMTEYDETLDLPVAFRKDNVEESFGEVISRAGLTQFRCAETEKYAHVTYFFNGGREQPFEGEDRKLVPSPRDIATYDLRRRR